MERSLKNDSKSDVENSGEIVLTRFDSSIVISCIFEFIKFKPLSVPFLDVALIASATASLNSAVNDVSLVTVL